MKDYAAYAPTVAWSLWDQFDTFLQSAMATDIDGDGRVEMIVSGANCSENYPIGVLSYFQYGDLSSAWSSDTSWGQVVSAGVYTPYVPTQSGPTNAWRPNRLDRYCAADVDGDGIDEIIAVSMFGIGVLKWITGAGLQIISSQTPPAPFASASLRAANLGHAEGESGDRVAVWSTVPEITGITVVGIFAWNGTGLVCESQTRILFDSDTAPVTARITAGNNRSLVTWQASIVSVWQASGNGLTLIHVQAFGDAALGRFVAADDLDGDGLDELLFFSVAFPLTVLKWSGSEFAVSSFPASIDLRDVGVPVKIPSLVPSGAVLPCSGSGFFNLCTWNSGSSSLTTVLSQGGNAAAGPGVQQPWVFSDLDQFFPVDLDGDGDQELVVYNAGPNHSGSNSVGVLKYSASSKKLELVSLATSALPGWSLMLLASAPATRFTPFHDVQQDIYRYVEKQLDHNLKDLRADYLNGADAGNFGGWAAQVADMPNPHPDRWDKENWRAVTETLQYELLAASQVWTYTGQDCQGGYITAAPNQQTRDFTAVYNSLCTDTPSANSTALFWFESLVDAALWGLAAAPVGPELQVGLAICAALLPSILASSSGPQQISLGEQGLTYLNQITAEFAAAASNAAQEEVSILSDPVKLSVLSVLVDNAWAWSANDGFGAAAAATSSIANQILFFQQLLPCTFQIYCWKNVPYNYPYFCGSRPFDKGNEYSPVAIDAPSESYVTYFDGSNYDIYMIGATTDPPQFSFPCDDVFEYIDNQLNIDKNDMFQGRRGWEAFWTSSSMVNPGTC